MLPNTVRYVEISKYFSVFPLFFETETASQVDFLMLRAKCMISEMCPRHQKRFKIREPLRL